MAAISIVGEVGCLFSEYYRANVEGGLCLLGAMRTCGVRRLVFSSSAAVYGESERQPLDEAAPTAPSSPYGDTKLAFERALQWYDRAYGIRHVSLRYFNAAGASETSGERHEPETHLIPLVLEVALGRRREVTVFGHDYRTRDGTCVRAYYIHVLDLARAHLLALNLLAQPATKSRVYNLGCGGAGLFRARGHRRRARGQRQGHRGARRTAPARRRRGAGGQLAAHRGGARLAPQRHLRAIVESAWTWTVKQAARPGRHPRAARDRSSHRQVGT